ncbi:MAG TPA: ABC transporter permease [Oscillospiraceae bacterium]|nr:ABC transporter permease [Oscillospiraceae bacterium]HPF55183.1 ABC transporter permease [Clostridiales bacterium]HPK36504.1 ABC transporter permease [Oscillospiraceae bacterium]HPR75737.1 ABC transporter permease [Oscillospiraceae bacterium]
MKKYLSFFKIRLINGLQYRAAAIAGMATQFFWGGMTLLMFWAFYQNGANEFPMTFPQLANYIWMQQAFLALYAAWSFDNDIFEAITSGNIAYELCRPVSIYTMWFVKNIAARYARMMLRCLPIFAVAVFLPVPFNLSAPVSLEAGLLFAVSLILGSLLAIAFVMLIYIATFYMLSSLGVRILFSSIVEFLSGAIIPIAFFPESVQKVLYLLPFAYTQNTPFQIYNGYLSGADAYQNILLQFVWLIALWLLGRLAMSRALKKVVVQGG